MYPVMLNITGKKCVVIGGGNAALHKAQRQSECGGDVVVVSPGFRDGFDGLKTVRKEYEKTDIEGAFLVTAATDDRELNRRIASEARSMGILVYVVDDAKYSDITLPAVKAVGDITVCASTNGKYPFLAKRLRDEAAADAEFYASILGALAEHRQRVLSSDKENKKQLLKRMTEDDMMELARNDMGAFYELCRGTEI